MNYLACVLASTLSLIISLAAAFGVGYFAEQRAVSDWMRFASWGFGLAPLLCTLISAFILALKLDAQEAYERGFRNGNIAAKQKAQAID